MLSYIFALIQEFKRNHGYLPQVVCLNRKHLRSLFSEYPDLLDQDQWPDLGFRVAIFSENELPHPKVVWLPRMPRKMIAQCRHFSVEQQQLREKGGV